MSVTQRRTRKAAAVALVAAVALSAAACSKKDESGGTTADGKIKLVVDSFGEFGYDELIKTYMASHPNITIEQRKTTKLDDYKPALVKYLAAGTGAGDVVALEEGIINEFKAQPDNWVDLKQYVGDLSADYLSWKYDAGKTADGSKLLGLPTDVGGLAMCYRNDLFKKAGLPTDRDEVSKLWPTWDKFIEVGKDYKAKTGKALIDSVTTEFSAIMTQLGEPLFYDRQNNVVAGTSQSVKGAWDKAVQMIEISSKTATWSDDWSAGFKKDTFAVVACPSWMLGIIETNSGPDNKGKWDVAAVPGGGGNWGGSWLSVPTQSKNPKEAAELAAFLTNADSQVAAFKAKGPLPSNLKALDNPDFQAYKNPYFSDAPVGAIFGAGAKTLQPVYLGPKHAAIKERAFEPALQSIEQGKVAPDKAWTTALAEAEKQAK
ncbi:extracellular solute-binding protein [Luedemannella helvata]|uniref:Extracellular solute-binding protein n=1 Tax=Luedemannella helvata TaxID=349315 RepID=A0ABP4XDR4_9ACTN